MDMRGGTTDNILCVVRYAPLQPVDADGQSSVDDVTNNG